MAKIVLLFLLTSSLLNAQNKNDSYITRHGQIAFFSYTAVENIEATNNQVLCVLNESTGEINISILMRAFMFKKKLMRDHFNESYIESDLYPKATFSGKIIDFNPKQNDVQTQIVEGLFTLKNKQVPLKFKVKIDFKNGIYKLVGTTETQVEKYAIKIPKLLTSNIAKNIQISFNLELSSYEE